MTEDRLPKLTRGGPRSGLSRTCRRGADPVREIHAYRERRMLPGVERFSVSWMRNSADRRSRSGVGSAGLHRWMDEPDSVFDSLDTKSPKPLEVVLHGFELFG
jgi:hypothetical protein